jgi:hypothetical protein
MHEFQSNVRYQLYTRNGEECNERMSSERVTYHSNKKKVMQKDTLRTPSPKRFSWKANQTSHLKERWCPLSHLVIDVQLLKRTYWFSIQWILQNICLENIMFHTVAKTTIKLNKHSACNHALLESTVNILPTCERIMLNFLCQDFLDLWHSLCHIYLRALIWEI